MSTSPCKYLAGGIQSYASSWCHSQSKYPPTAEKMSEDAKESKEPLFWYSEYWLQRIYIEGAKDWFAYCEQNPPRRYIDDEGVAREKGNCRYFYWTPMKDGHVGYRLMGLMSIATNDHAPVVEIRRSSEYEGHRLYASRDFAFGDVIIFFSELEERTGLFLFGGSYARSCSEIGQCNAYQTSGRVLRCLKRIKKGEEIVRMIKTDECIWTLEIADRVVVHLDKMKMGKIGCDREVYYSDETTEGCKARHLPLFTDGYARAGTF